MKNKNRRPSLVSLLAPLGLGLALQAQLAGATLTLDTSFDTDGIAQVDFTTGTDTGFDLAEQADGALLLVGTSRQTAGADTLDYVALTRVDGTTGAIDATFGSGGKVTFLPGVSATNGGGGVGRAVVIQPVDQKIVVAGTWQAAPQQPTQAFVARFDANGAPDNSFGTNGVVLLTPAGVTNPAGNAVAVRSNGSIIIAGSGTTVSGAGVGFIAGLNSAGNAIPGFTNTVVPNPLAAPDGADFSFNALVILPGDAILAGGGGGDLTLVRFTSAGLPDGNFATDGIASFNFFTFDTATGPIPSDDAITELAVLSDGRILFAGKAVAGATKGLLGRLTSAGELDATFGSGGYAPLADDASNGVPTGLGVRPSGDIVLTGAGFKPVQISPNGLAQSQLAGVFAVGVNSLKVLAGGDVAVAGLRIVAGEDSAFAAARFTATDLADGADTAPDPFAFTTQTGLETGITATSNAVTIQGIDAPATISVTSGDQYAIGCSTYTSTPGTISNGQSVCVRTTTPDNGTADSRAFLTVGGTAGQFAVITGDATPDQFSFVDQTGVAVNTAIVSAPITLTGLAIRTDVSVTGGSFSVGCTGTYTVSVTTVDPGTQICVRHTASATPGATTNTTLTVGKGDTIEDTFTTTTGGDITPNAFTFVDQTGVAKSTLTVSAPVTLSGFTDTAPITVSGGEYSVGCTASFTSAPGTVAPAATVCVRHTSSAIGGTATNTTLTVGAASGLTGTSDTFTSTTEGATDTTPDSFSFPAQTSVPLGTTLTSGAISLTGYDTAATITVSGGTYSKNCASGGFTSAAGTLAPNTSVCVRHTSASTGGTATNTVLTVGGVAGTFTSTTLAGDAVPAAFTFPSQTGVPLLTDVTSAPATITGIDIASPVTVANGEYSIGCTSTFTAAQSSISNGQAICVRHQSSFNSSEDVATVLTIGTVSGTFTSTTKVGDQVPDDFSFTTQTGVARNTVVTSNPITVTGVDSKVGILVSGTIGSPGPFPTPGFSRGCTGSVNALSGDTLEPGETICVSVFSADSDLTSVVATITIGGNGVGNRKTETFTVTTGETVPDTFVFADQVDVPTLTTIYAAPVLITGITGPSRVTISQNGQYQVNCTGGFTSSAGTVEDGNTICIRHVSSASLSTETSTTLTVGGVSDTFTSTTTADSTPLPGSSAMDAGSLLLLVPLLARRRRRRLS
ncbi:MAG: hypothetical protein ABIX37_08880 [Gammaproteobacteria bacterium]